MSGRIRRPSASTSASTPRGQGSRYRLTGESPRSESATPVFEEDEEGKPKRSTRGRNPLPPSSGPLFPPLPPKLPKSRVSGNSLSSVLDPPIDVVSPAQSEKPDLPTTSNASLTPPPPGSEDVLLDDDEEDETGNGDEQEDVEMSEGIRPKIEVEEVDGKAEIKLEDQVRNGSERASSQSRAKRRRGEEALLLDDHLLPPEIRHISQPSSRRGSYAKEHLEEEKRKKEKEKEVPAPQPAPPVEDVQMEEPPVEGEDEIDDAEAEDDKEDKVRPINWDDETFGGDVTRCVCHLEDPDDNSMMIQCDECNVWQHGACMGIWGDDDAPDEYFCELCRPDLHGPLKRWIRRCGRDPANFVPPTYDDLRSMRPHNDKSAPSQSKVFLRDQPTPPPPPKPASRSHHKKEVDPPAEAPQDGRRSGRRLAFPDRPSSKSRDTQPVKPPVLPKRKSSTGQAQAQARVESTSPNRSLSPSAQMHSAARRRITMNSRDSMFEEEVRAAMEASRREALGLSPVAEPVAEEVVEDEEVEKHETKKGKRKRDEEDPASVDGGAPNSKAKHPNQYTYRPKPLSSSQPAAAPSPARRGAAGGTPVPSSIAPPQHEHGTRRAGAIANGAITNPNLSASSVASLNWYIPDYLSTYTDLLPTPQPVALGVRSQRSLPHVSRNHHHHQRYGPFTEERDEEGRLILPEEIPMREPAGEAETHLEPPARVKYPAKRITVGEIRKRVRSMLDYVSKAQTGEEKRLERSKVLGIVVTPLPRKKDKGKANGVEDQDRPEAGLNGDEAGSSSGSGRDNPDIENSQDVIHQDKDVDMNVDHSAENGARSPSPLPPRTSAELMEELTRDLIAFQEMYLSNTSNTPLPAQLPTVDVPLPVPDIEAEAEPEVEVVPQSEPDSESVLLQEDAVPTDGGEVVGEGALESEKMAIDEPEVEPDHQLGQQEGDLDREAAAEPELELDVGVTEEPDNQAELEREANATQDSSDQVDGDNAEHGIPLEPETIPASAFEIPPPVEDPLPELPDPELEAITATTQLPTSELDLDDFDMPKEMQSELDRDTDMAVIEPAASQDVYREGQVDKVIISGQEERNVVDSLEEVAA